MAISDITTTPATEEWCDVRGYEGLYQVSNLGRVRSLPRSDPRGNRIGGIILKPYLTRHGYEQVSLSRYSLEKKHSVHIMVALAFLGERPTKHDINHLDGNKRNNTISNLEYCTRSRNTKHAFEIGKNIPLQGEQIGCATLTNIEVLEIVRLFRSGSSKREIAQRTDTPIANVRSILEGWSWWSVTGIPRRRKPSSRPRDA